MIRISLALVRVSLNTGEENIFIHFHFCISMAICKPCKKGKRTKCKGILKIGSTTAVTFFGKPRKKMTWDCECNAKNHKLKSCQNTSN